MNKKESIQKTDRKMLLDETIKNYLPSDFSPTALDVVCARGKEAYMHPGNKRYRDIISKYLKNYIKAETKNEKSSIVLKIVQEVRNDAPAGFIRFCNIENLWYEIGDESSREKVGQTIRETLTQQDPLKRAKQRMKRALNKAKRLAAQQAADFEPIPLSQSFDVFHLTNNQNSIDITHRVPILETSTNKHRKKNKQRNQEEKILNEGRCHLRHPYQQQEQLLLNIANQKGCLSSYGNSEIAPVVISHQAQFINHQESHKSEESHHCPIPCISSQPQTQSQVVDSLPFTSLTSSAIPSNRIVASEREQEIISPLISSTLSLPSMPWINPNSSTILKRVEKEEDDSNKDQFDKFGQIRF